MLPFTNAEPREENIVIVGLGGAGAHILQRFSGSSAQNVRLCIMSPDERLGRDCGNVEFLQLGAGMNHGMGSGGDPEVGRLSIEESRSAIKELLSDARLLVMVVGLGGGTGSGAAPVLAQMAVDAGVMLVSVAVLPFSFEGKRRRRQAETALDDITRLSDIVFCFENDYMEDFLPSTNSMNAVFEETNTILSQATAAIPLFANTPGLINIGLDELMTALKTEDSRCIYGTGKGYGAHRAEDAARAALESPLVAYHQALTFAHSVIVNVAGGSNMSLTEVRTAMETVTAALPEDVDIFYGAAVKPRLGEEMRVSLLASVDANEFRAAVQADKEAAAAEAAESGEPAVEPEPETVVTDDTPAAEPAFESYAGAESPVDEEEEVITEEESEDASPEIFAADDDDRIASRLTAPAEPREMVQDDLFAPAAAKQTSLHFGSEDEPSVVDTHGGAVDDDFARRVRSLFPEDGAEATSAYTAAEAAPRRRSATRSDNLDTPPSLRFNDLRDMFPDE